MFRIAAASLFAFAVAAPFAGAASLNYYNYDTRSQGAYDQVATPTNDGDGSLRLRTFDASGNGKVSVVFRNGTDANQPLGTLGSLNQLALDFFKASDPAASAVSSFAYRIQLSSGGTTALVWENQYNGNNAVATDMWNDNFSLANGNFWERGNGINFNGGSQAHPLSYWAAGNAPTTDASGNPATAIAFNADTPVYGFEIAYGSGVGAFTGYVDDINVGFAGGQSFVANVVPEPASLAVLGLGALGTLVRRRRTVA